MTTRGISQGALLAQEECFARAFAARDPAVARDLYQPDVVYVSPTVRLFDWPARIEGIERTMEFITLTIRACSATVRGGGASHHGRRRRGVRAGAVRLDGGRGTFALNVRGDLPLSRRPYRSPGAVLRPERLIRATGARLTEPQSG